MEIKSMFKKSLNIVLIVTFFASSLMPVPKAHAQGLGLPAPGIMVNLSPAFEPVLIKGIKVHPENPFQFDFIVDTGHSDLKAGDQALKDESNRLIKYFLASMTIPEKDLWVNLSPYEKDRMIADNLGTTQMGQDMLAQDYILKQLTASLIYPEKDLGKAFWDKVYTKAQQLYGTTEIPINTFNKVWIVADKADVFERGNVAYIVGAHLKVMLEEDYLALEKNTKGEKVKGWKGEENPLFTPSPKTADQPSLHPHANQPATYQTNQLGSQIVRDIILPSIEQEVNQGKNFAPLRQMFYSMILASWYKMALKDTILTQLYGNQSKVKVGINANNPADKGKIFEQYLKAYKKGVFNYIKEDMDAVSKRPMPRKYFSGGLQIGTERVMRRNQPWNDKAMTGNIFQVSGGVNVEKSDGAMTASADLGNVMSDEQARQERETAQIRREYEEVWRGSVDPVNPLSPDVTDHRLADLMDRLDQIQVAGDLVAYKAYLIQRMQEMRLFLAEQIRVAGKTNGVDDGDHAMLVVTAAERKALRGQTVSFVGMPHDALEALDAIRILQNAIRHVAKPTALEIRDVRLLAVKIEDYLRDKPTGNRAVIDDIISEMTMKFADEQGGVKVSLANKVSGWLSQEERKLLGVKIDAVVHQFAQVMTALASRRIPVQKARVDLKGLLDSLQEIEAGDAYVKQYKAQMIRQIEGKIRDLEAQIASDTGASDEAMTVSQAARAAIERLVTEDMPRTFAIPESLAPDVRRIVAALGGFVRYDGRVYYNSLEALPSLEPEEFEFLWRHGDNTERLRITADRLTAMVDDIWQEDNKVAADFVQLIRGGADAAMTAKVDQAAMTPGGIDLNRAKMQMNVRKEGAGVQMQFDPAMIERIKREGFDGLEFKIDTIIPITNLPMLLLAGV